MKEQLQSAFCRSENLPVQYVALQLLLDLYRHTLQRRCNFATNRKALWNYKVPHKWKYPATFSITHYGVTISVTSMQEGLEAPRQWGIIPEQTPTAKHALQLPLLQGDWQVVSHKWSNKRGTFQPDDLELPTATAIETTSRQKLSCQNSEYSTTATTLCHPIHHQWLSNAFF